MLAEGNSASLFGEPYFFKSNDPLLLDDPETIWFVQSGSLAIFAINVQNGIPKGRRRYLFSVKAGEAMFCATLTSAAGQYQILAVALEATELVQVSKQDFCESLGEDTIIDNMITFLIAGHETTSGLLSFLWYYMLKSPEAYRKAKEEVDTVLGTRSMQFEDLGKLPYITAMLRETWCLAWDIPIDIMALGGPIDKLSLGRPPRA